jgi:hypothetical protein
MCAIHSIFGCLIRHRREASKYFVIFDAPSKKDARSIFFMVSYFSPNIAELTLWYTVCLTDFIKFFWLQKKKFYEWLAIVIILTFKVCLDTKEKQELFYTTCD